LNGGLSGLNGGLSGFAGCDSLATRGDQRNRCNGCGSTEGRLRGRAGVEVAAPAPAAPRTRCSAGTCPARRSPCGARGTTPTLAFAAPVPWGTPPHRAETGPRRRSRPAGWPRAARGTIRSAQRGGGIKKENKCENTNPRARTSDRERERERERECVCVSIERKRESKARKRSRARNEEREMRREKDGEQGVHMGRWSVNWRVGGFRGVGGQCSTAVRVQDRHWQVFHVPNGCQTNNRKKK